MEILTIEFSILCFYFIISCVVSTIYVAIISGVIIEFWIHYEKANMVLNLFYVVWQF